MASSTTLSEEQVGSRKEAPASSILSKSIPNTPGGKPYLLFNVPRGQMVLKVQLLGALIPDGYSPVADSALPWVCPVKSCSECFSKLEGLDVHFYRDHEAEAFNDNLDGTLSSVGHRAREGIKTPAIVVSQKPLGSGDVASPDSMATQSSGQDESVSSFVTAMNSEEMAALETAPSDNTLSSPTRPQTEREDSLWDYICAHVHRHPPTTFGTHTFMPTLLSMPRLRDLKLEGDTGTFKVIMPEDFLAAVLYLTGMESPNPCFRCLCRKGPFEKCIIIHPDVPTEIREEYRCCSNCIYRGHNEHCGLDARMIHDRNEQSSSTSQRAITISSTSESDEEMPDIPTMLDALTAQQPRKKSTTSITKNFSDLAVACYHDAREHDQHNNTAGLLPAAEVTPTAARPSNPVAGGERSGNLSDGSYADDADSATSATPQAEQPVPSSGRRSLRLVLKESAVAAGSTPSTVPATTPKKKSKTSSKMPVGRSAPQGEDANTDLAFITPPTRRSTRLSMQTPVTRSTHKNKPRAQRASNVSISSPKRGPAKKRKQAPEVSGGGESAGTAKPHIKRRSTHHSYTSPTLSTTGTMMPPTPPSSEDRRRQARGVYELEDWEVAPGRIRSGSNNIAFSTSFLRSNIARRIDSKIAFHVVVVHAGMTHRLEADAHSTRVVSVTNGKIEAKMGLDNAFIISTNGAVKVPLHTLCVFKNYYSMDVTLHICSS